MYFFFAILCIKDLQNTIGASYFLTIDGEGTARETIEPLWNNKLLPLLIDYFRGEHESEKKIRLMEDAYFENEGEA